MKKTEIGTKGYDDFFFMNHLNNEDDPYIEEDDDFEMPKLLPSKISYFDLVFYGKKHPLADQILTWQAEMEMAGRYDEIPDDPDKIIAMFESGELPAK